MEADESYFGGVRQGRRGPRRNRESVRLWLYSSEAVCIRPLSSRRLRRFNGGGHKALLQQLRAWSHFGINMLNYPHPQFYEHYFVVHC